MMNDVSLSILLIDFGQKELQYRRFTLKKICKFCDFRIILSKILRVILAVMEMKVEN